MDETRLTARIAKIEPEQRRFYGWGYVWKKADGSLVVDHSGDRIDTPEARQALEDSFHRYVRDSGDGGDNHELFGASKLIEAVAITKEKAQLMGIDGPIQEGLWVGFEAMPTPAGDALWDRVKSGEGQMLSIEGRGFYR